MTARYGLGFLLLVLATASCGHRRPTPPTAASVPPAAGVAPVVPEAGGYTITAHYESPPDTLDYLPPCTATSPVPDAGICRGTGRSTTPTTVTGDLEGRIEYTYGWATLPSGTMTSAAIATFTGGVRGCGTGTMTYRRVGTEDQDGDDDYQWEIVDGLGTGELAGLRGRGTLNATFHDDLSASGNLQGSVSCHK